MISQSTQKLIQRYQTWYAQLQAKEGIPTLHVDEVASKVAAFYEKVRGVIDWREEHLLRKAAIERHLKRRLILNKNGREVAGPLVLELIRGGHFPNDKIEETKIEEIKKVIDKYIFIIKNAPIPPKEKRKVQLQDWILGIAACEVEETLDPRQRENAQMEYMAELMFQRIEVKGGLPDYNPPATSEVPSRRVAGESESHSSLYSEWAPTEKNIQIYIAVQKALFKLDSPIISYNLLKKRYPQWQILPLPLLEEITKNIYSIWENIEKDLKHPLAEKFYRVCEQYDTSYLILGDIFSQDPPKIQEKIQNPEILENSIKDAYQKRLKQLKSRLGRAAIYVTLSIFVTKMLLAFAIEVPFDKYVTGEFNLFTLGLNILIPPFLMFFLVLTIRPPGKENFQKVILEVMKIVHEQKRKDIYQIKDTPKRGLILKSIIFLFYFITFVVSFGLIWWVLSKLDFGILSKIIFLIFISLISFAGVKIRERAKELQVEPDKGNIFTFFMDTFSLPFIRMGKWLSAEFARFNIIVVFFNSLIDMPFQIFVEFLEQWRYYLKEKREEIH